jgi:2-dehydropantoate 2-reductase
MFGATYLEAGKVVHNFEGNWIIGNIFGNNNAKVVRVSSVLSKIFPIIVSHDIKGMKYLKIFINANNCIPAILGMSMQEAFSDLEISRISIAIWKEGLDVAKKSGIGLVSLPDFPLERLAKLTSLPTIEAAKIFSGIMSKLSREPLYGSILQSIKRGRASEIDYINGEFANIAKGNNLRVPLNEKLIEMVHQVEKTNRFFSKKELIQQVKGLVN